MRPAVLNPLFADTTTLKGVGPRLAALIAKVAGPRVVDVLFTGPHGVIDRSNRPKIADAAPGEIVTLEATIDRHQPNARKNLPYRILCSDETGFVTLVYFHARPDFLKRLAPEGARRIISGRIEEFAGGRQIAHPDHVIDPAASSDLPLFEPVYPLTAGLAPAVMKKAAHAALAAAPNLPEWQDAAWRAKCGYPDWREALSAYHQPNAAADLSPASPARARLAYDELLSSQLAMALVRRSRRKQPGRAFHDDAAARKRALNALPFTLTEAQRQALAEIDADMATHDRMVRLLQGDVGSGKTAVAFLAMARAIAAGAQAAIIAPTEILARQHFETLHRYATAATLCAELFTGRDKGRQRMEKLERLAAGAIDIAIGTHALISDDISFRDLGLVVIDEQHRFGVAQRAALTRKGARADLLVMTATPIPRTLALALYGDMDQSEIRAKPPGRKPVTTIAKPIERLDEVVAAVSRAIEAQEQIYWVCPLVEESEFAPATAAEERFEALAARFGAKVGIVHGRMATAEKDAAMERFHSGEISVLVATTVIEVGVNAPAATVMVIEHAERFGLAQLHQLRGRVGRGDKPAVCLLLYKGPLGETARARIDILRQTDDGFAIAEEDLRLRGAGDFLGSAQSGFPDFRFANPSVHGSLLEAAADDARMIVDRDGDLATPRGEALRILLYLFSRDDAVKLLRDAG